MCYRDRRVWKGLVTNCQNLPQHESVLTASLIPAQCKMADSRRFRVSELLLAMEGVSSGLTFMPTL